jgi:DNA-binding transcriptional LysR family regulator
MDLNLLSTFVAVAETASFSTAARKLGVPTSTASRAVARLEAALGTRLFHRTTRHVSLSTDGAALLARIGPALGSLGAALGTLPPSDEPTGVLRVTAAPDIGSALLAGAVARFTARYPAVTVDMWLTTRRVNLAAEGFDAAVRGAAGQLADSTLVARKLAPIELRLYGSPDYLAAHPAPRQPADVAHHRWVEFRGWKYPRELVRPPHGAHIVCDDFDFVRGAVRAGAGLGMLPWFRAEPDVAAGLLVPVLPRVTQTGGHFVLLHARQHASRKLLAFRDFLVDELAPRRRAG